MLDARGVSPANENRPRADVEASSARCATWARAFARYVIADVGDVTRPSSPSHQRVGAGRRITVIRGAVGDAGSLLSVFGLGVTMFSPRALGAPRGGRPLRLSPCTRRRLGAVGRHRERLRGSRRGASSTRVVKAVGARGEERAGACCARGAAVTPWASRFMTFAGHTAGAHPSATADTAAIVWDRPPSVFSGIGGIIVER